jgi:TfoX/Sxy family transcriptional regulator of competence genes
MAKRKPTRAATPKLKKKRRPMPAFTKAPPEMVDLFTGAVAGLPGIETRQMFGYPAAFAKGQMFASLFQSEMILRLSETDRRTLADEGGRPFEPMPGRPMREYVTVPAAVRASREGLHAWIVKARAYAESLPRKKKSR